MKFICCGIAALALASCAQVSRMKDATVGGFTKIGEVSKDGVAKLMPSRIPVVEPREGDLKELKSGEQQAVAFEKTRRNRFWFFGGPADFVEPELPDANATAMDGSLLPPKIE